MRARLRPKILPIAFACLLASAGARPGAAFDEALYARLLERHTVAVEDIASTRVDYHALAASSDWERLVESLAGTDPASLTSRAERLAFWIDAYNVLAIDLVRRNLPLESIREIGSFFSPVWKKEAGRIGGRAISLDEIEHGILRPMGDPRIHGAIVCASLSCPPLRREPYRASELDAQLDDNVRRWLADPRKGVRIDRAARTIHVSAIFDWFEEDFEPDVPSFVARYLEEDEAAWLRQARGQDLTIRYLDYDWRLNDLATRPGKE